jgi:primosomal protein N' (replication factor Y)
MFPDARIMRMDQDSTRRKGSHVQIIDKVSRGEVDILLGTQMVAKGLNFPGVSLVGVLQADIGLHIPDFRSAERTYQLVSQVAGRAGREDDAGEVVVQTYVPNEPCIQASLRHDYDGFYGQEIDSRQMLNYPPFSKLARVVVSGEQEAAVADCANSIGQMIRSQADPSVTVLGPVPAMIARIKNAYRYSILLKATQVKAFGATIAAVRRGPWQRRRDVRVIVDVDPISMM